MSRLKSAIRLNKKQFNRKAASVPLKDCRQNPSAPKSSLSLGLTAPWKSLGLEVWAGNSRLQLPDAYARLKRDFKIEIPV
jgi:hypothetical protein